MDAEKLQECFEIWENELNSLTDFRSVRQYSNRIFQLVLGYFTTFRSRLDANEKRVAEYKRTRQAIERSNKNLKISGKKLQRRQESQEAIENVQLEIRKLKNENKRISTFLYVLDVKDIRFQQQLAAKIDTFRRGLSPERIQKFTQFTADQSHVGDECAICMGDIEIGRNMMRLNCDGQHTFCQVCIEGWFADHKTCPLCRHKF